MATKELPYWQKSSIKDAQNTTYLTAILDMVLEKKNEEISKYSESAINNLKKCFIIHNHYNDYVNFTETSETTYTAENTTLKRQIEFEIEKRKIALNQLLTANTTIETINNTNNL